MADRRPLINESPYHSNATPPLALPSLGFHPQFGFEAPPDVSPPSSPPTSYRPGYSRIQSDGAHGSNGGGVSARGLGIKAAASPPAYSENAYQNPIPEIRVPRHESTIMSAMSTGDPLIGGFPQDSAGSTPDLRRDRFSAGFSPGNSSTEFQGPYNGAGNEYDYQQYLHSPTTQRIVGPGTSIGSRVSAYDANKFRPSHECPTSKDIHLSRWSWVSISIILICLFSTVFSGIFLGLAMDATRYGRSISSQGSFSPSGAIVLTSVMAKVIELSFVTGFVAFIGQVLSRRSFMKHQGRGVTLSELSMWRWVVQPGTLITHWETARYAGLSVLGILSLLSAILATLYSPAATAIVQPSLKASKWQGMSLEGQVAADFANMYYVNKMCETPIKTDPEYGSTTCLQIEHAGQGFHNYQKYLAIWTNQLKIKNSTADQRWRPNGTGLLHENTTITGQWIDIINTTAVSKAEGRVINNVSLAMPHAGVFQAAHNQVNGIMQPEELNSEGTYTLRASVPSPVMNVLCVNMNADELKPIVYEEWPNSGTVNGTSWLMTQQNFATTTNNTKVDNLFGWTKKDPNRQDYPPVFAKLPMPFNTILNHTNDGWGRDSIYLLGQGGSTNTGTYVLCKMHMAVTAKCSTHYTATGSGGFMEAHCDPTNEMTYEKKNSNATGKPSIPNWMDIGSAWGNSLSLNTGIDDANASNSRLMTQLIIQPSNSDPKNFKADLNDQLPSVAEAISVLAGCTLLKSSIDAPFADGPFNYTENLFPDKYYLLTPETQYFEAKLQAQQYASGGPDSASRAWLIVLILVFAMNLLILLYFLFHNGLVTDFSAPPYLFALAINSPPSHTFKGSCGGGPEGKQYEVNWFVNNEGDHLFMEPGEKEVSVADLASPPGVGVHAHEHYGANGIAHMHPQAYDAGAGGPVYPSTEIASKKGFFGKVSGGYSRLRERGMYIGKRENQRTMRPLSVVGNDEFEMVGEGGLEQGVGGESRTQRQYAMLAHPNRRSLL